MKIVYCKDTLTISAGMERVLTTKANWLAENNHEVHIITRYGDYSFFPLSERVIVHNTHSHSQREYEKNVRTLLYEIKPEIAISMYESDATFLYKIKDGSKKIIEFHFSRYYLTHLVKAFRKLRLRPLHLLKAKYFEHKNKSISKKYDTVVLLTKQDKNLWGNKSNMTFFPNPLSFRSEEKSSLENKRILVLGRLFPQKGIDLLIESFSKISSKYPEWILDIFGEGQDRDMLTELIQKKRLEKQIFLHPTIKNVKPELLNSAIMAFPSRYEGFGLVLTEAMECGVPCVAFDCECGPSEIIQNNIDGFTVPEGDIDALAEKLEVLIKNESLRKEMGKKASESVKRFYPETIMPKWIELFKTT